mgnify:CR=1 FL=1
MSILIEGLNIYQEFEGEELFKPFTFNVKDHDRIALLGQNGTGKSTIFKIILNKMKPTSGSILIPKNVKIGYLSQDVISNENNTLYEEVLDTFKDNIILENKLNDISNKLALDSNNDDYLKKYQSTLDEFEAIGGYSYQYKVNMILSMFNFTKDDYERKISTFSGGEKTRICFSKILLDNPDVLILDEPTNHLSILSIEWLEDYLSSYSGAVLFSSHDLAFVRKISNRIMEIENKEVSIYNMTYDNFAKEKKNRYERQLTEYKLLEEEKAKLRKFITFYMPKPRFASRAHDREKKLARLENLNIKDPRANSQRNLNFSLNGMTRSGKKLIDFNDVSIGYDKPLISDITFTLFGQDRLAVIGNNGIGKTTFAKTLLDEIKPLSGNIRRYFDLSIGILKQDIMSYKEDISLFDHLRNLYPHDSNEELYSLFARYSFSYDEVSKKKLNNLSGGEMMRLEMLILSKENYDLLILDEPTNHLDLLSISELIDAISSYQGTMVIISHNRDFIDKVCSKILFFLDGKSYYYDGGYEEFKNTDLKKIMENKKEEYASIKKENKKEEKVIINKSKGKMNVDALLKKIERLENNRKQLVDDCNKEENYSSKDKLETIEKKIKEIDEELSSLYKKLDNCI